ncbi:MAG TPA: molybdopterin-dependent oxidoreductase, partial [Thermoanaerobaculia bacterium]
MNDAPHTGPDRVPPGQYTTDKWPVLTYGSTPRVDPETWTFRISGLVAAERVFSWQEFQALPRVRITADFHCVTRFSTLDNVWEGVATLELLRHVQVGPEASHVLVHCYGGYTTNLP